MSQGNNFPQRPPREKHGLDNRKLNLNAPTPNVPGQRASLIWGFYANNPRITVYTGDPAEKQDRNKDYGKISANMDMPAFFVFLDMLKQIVVAEPDTKLCMENKNFTFYGGKRSDAPAIVSETWVGKDKDGVIALCISAKDRPRIKFLLTLSDFHNLKKGDGTPFTQGEVSVMVTKAYIDMLSNMMSNMAIQYYEEPKPKDAPGGNRQANNGYGGNNNNNRGNSGGGNAAADNDDDIPF